MSAKSPGLFKGIFFDPFGFSIPLSLPLLTGALAGPGRTYTPDLYTGLLWKGCWDGGAPPPLSPLSVGEFVHLFSFPGNLDLNQFKWY